MVLIGYSGHGYVACSIIQAMGKAITGYCDMEPKTMNPFQLKYLGRETDPDAIKIMLASGCFIAVGDNGLRQKIASGLEKESILFQNIIHPSAIVTLELAPAQGIMVAPHVVIHPLSSIGRGVICNTASVIEHDCVIGEFAHIAPGAILCGNVEIGIHSFVGAGSVIRPGIKVGKDVIIGAGSVVVKDIPDGSRVMGNPAR